MSEEKNDGGPAFPELGERGIASGNEGMSLRDWFAGQALAGIMADPAAPGAKTAEICYAIADAMLKAREQQ